MRRVSTNVTLSRRTVLRGLMASAGTALSAMAQSPGSSDAGIERLYQRSIVIDALASPQSHNVGLPPKHQPLSQNQLRNVRASGITAVNVSVDEDTFDDTIKNIAFWMEEQERRPDEFFIVRNARELRTLKETNKLGLMFGFQGSAMLDRDLSRLVVFRRLGVRIIQPTYNTRSLAGDGCMVPADGGLTEFGKAMVARMSELGIALDLSHCGVQTTLDGIRSCPKPVIISHSGCKGVHLHPRNKSDIELRQMADRGGVIGIYLMPYLGGVGAASKELVVDHIDYALKICGADHVGIGTDQSITPIAETPEYLNEKHRVDAGRLAAGIAAPEEHRPLYVPELNSPRRIEMIALEMHRRGHSEATIEKVIGGNFLRALSEIWE